MTLLDHAWLDCSDSSVVAIFFHRLNIRPSWRRTRRWRDLITHPAGYTRVKRKSRWPTEGDAQKLESLLATTALRPSSDSSL
jgi:hypothetical protein